MYTMNVPKQFWPNALLAACYLINGMPSAVLNFVTPLSVLCPDDPLHVVQPRVFGCVCFVHNLDHPHDKLSAKAITCVFIGYPPCQKGYKCYSPSLRRVFVSADVTFFKDQPFTLLLIPVALLPC